MIAQQGSQRARLVLPYLPPEEYDFAISFTVPSKFNQLCQIFSQGERSLDFVAVAGDQKGLRCGYELVEGKSISDNPTLIQGKPVINPGQRYALVTQVRKGRVRTLLDGDELVSYRTDFFNTSPHNLWTAGEKGKGRLCLGAMGETIFHSAKVIEISGRGRIERVQGASVTQTVPDTSTAQATTSTPPAAPEGDKARQAWAVFLDEVTRHMQRDDTAAAKKRVDDALTDASLVPLKNDLEKDAKLVQYAADVEQAKLDGLALLKDKRAFTFERKDDKPLKVGEGSRNKVIKVAGAVCEVEQEVAGGGKVGVSVSLRELTRPTQIALAQLVLTDKPADQIKLLATEVARYSPGGVNLDLSILNRRLDAVAKDAEQAPFVERLRKWLAQKDRERDFEVAIANVTTIVGKNEFEPAKAALEDLKKSFFDTAVFASSGQRIADLEKSVKALDLKTGLWAMFYNKKNNNHMGDLRCSEEITKLDEDYKEGSPRNGVNKDDFGVRARGLLLIGQNGKYEFQVRGDDYTAVYVDGKKVCEDYNKGGNAGSVELTAGQHRFTMIFRENGGSASWSVQWKKPGDAPFSPIPASVLRYDPSKKSEYEKND